MEIVVCLKQVPDTETQIKISGDNKSIETGDIKWIMNPYDEYGVEEALQLKEKYGGTVTVVGAGPARVLESLRTALAMGVDKAVHIEFDTENLASYAIAETLAAAIKELDYDVIFCGQRGIDGDQAQAGAAIAEFLGLPQLSLITKVEVAEDGSKVTVERPIEGRSLVIESSLPAVITTQKGLNEPRYASLPGIMKAKRKPMDKKDPEALGVTPSNKVETLSITPPPERAPGKIIDGETAEEKAVELVRLLHEEAKVV
ncbi:MAG: electron transfer flavoprotein subunit beta/FixA family protein [Candidatus Adiutricales bacterium]